MRAPSAERHCRPVRLGEVVENLLDDRAPDDCDAEHAAAEVALTDAAEELRDAMEARFRLASVAFERTPCAASYRRFVQAAAMRNVAHQKVVLGTIDPAPATRNSSRDSLGA